MKIDLKELKQVFINGDNIISYLKREEKDDFNLIKAIEIAYDLQSGSYIDHYNNNQESCKTECSEYVKILKQHIKIGDRVLDCGTGEMTNLFGIFNKNLLKNMKIYCFDISLSRILYGRKFLNDNASPGLIKSVVPFVADINAIPLMNNSMDVIFSMHGLEPNHGREKNILKEIFRVARRKVILFEPSFEKNSIEGQKRMEEHGYIRNLTKYIEDLGGVIEDIIKLDKASKNPLNKTYAHVIKPPLIEEYSLNESLFTCPINQLKLNVERKDCYYSHDTMYIYPIISSIPILKKEAAIISYHTNML